MWVGSEMCAPQMCREWNWWQILEKNRNKRQAQKTWPNTWIKGLGLVRWLKKVFQFSGQQTAEFLSKIWDFKLDYFFVCFELVACIFLLVARLGLAIKATTWFTTYRCRSTRTRVQCKLNCTKFAALQTAQLQIQRKKLQDSFKILSNNMQCRQFQTLNSRPLFYEKKISE